MCVCGGTKELSALSGSCGRALLPAHMQLLLQRPPVPPCASEQPGLLGASAQGGTLSASTTRRLGGAWQGS